MPILLAILLSFLPYADSTVNDAGREKPAKQYPKLVTMGLNLWERLKQPDPKLETEWIYQPQKGFGVGLGYELTQMGVSLSSQTSSVMDTDGKMVANFDFRLAPYFNHRLGIRGTAGPLSAGYSFELKKKGERPSRSLFF